MRTLNTCIHYNSSNEQELYFTTVFTGQEFFLVDHIIGEFNILPGVVLLEIIQAAIRKFWGVSKKENIRILLKNIIFVRPVVIEKNKSQVHIHFLFKFKKNGQITYKIYSKSKKTKSRPVIYSVGHVESGSLFQVFPINFDTLLHEFTYDYITPSQCYEVFKKMGVNHGTSLQGIEKVYVGSNQILAKLSLPAVVFNTIEQFILHPSLMDSALQVSMLMINKNWALLNTDISIGLFLPFAFSEVEIYSRCTSVMWLLVKYSKGSSGIDIVQKLDAELFDNHGNICLRIKEFSVRNFNK